MTSRTIIVHCQSYINIFLTQQKQWLVVHFALWDGIKSSNEETRHKSRFNNDLQTSFHQASPKSDPAMY
jgi:hypothetical protein